MSPLDPHGQLLIIAAALLSTGSALALTPLASTIVRRAPTWSADAQRRTLVGLAFAPLLLAVVALGAVLLPSLFAATGGGDHCHEHGGHLHLCLVHLAEHPASALAAVIASALLARLAWLVGAGLISLLRAARPARLLLRHARREGDAHILPMARPICLSLGLLRPRLVLSEGFLAALTPDQRLAAIAHEGAHIVQRDALTRLIAGAAARLYPAPLRRRLLAALDTAMERAADEAAASTLGDRLVVASALVAAERAIAAHPLSSPLVMAIDGGTLGIRVSALLDEQPQERSPRWLLPGLALALALIVGLHDPLHHAVESALDALFH